MDDALTSAEQHDLLRLARASLREGVSGEEVLQTILDRVEITPALRQPRGAFVTLRLRSIDKPLGELRGCIGSMTGDRPLYRTVIEMARRSALSDPRFTPVSAKELPLLRVEVSALTPLRPLAGVDEIVVGRDGVQLTQGPHRAVFLPQVASEQGWNAEQLLEHLALKAGLGRHGWRGATLQAFCAEVFGEDYSGG